MTKLIQLPKSIANLTDQQLGRQLVDQYKRACDGMVEYVAFGALAENAKVRIDSARGVDSPKDGRGAKGTGFKAWLNEYTGGQISEPTAYRYMELSDIVRAEVGAGQKVDLYHVLRGEKLDTKEAKLREKVSAFVAGKTQRQLLLAAGKWESGRRAPAVTKESEEERHARLVEAAKATAVAAFSAFHEVGDRWMLVTKEQLELAIEDAKKFTKRAEKWLETPAADRVQFKIESLLGEEAP